MFIFHNDISQSFLEIYFCYKEQQIHTLGPISVPFNKHRWVTSLQTIVNLFYLRLDTITTNTSIIWENHFVITVTDLH